MTQREALTIVVAAMCDHGFMNGWMGDVGPGFQADQVSYLMDMDEVRISAWMERNEFNLIGYCGLPTEVYNAARRVSHPSFVPSPLLSREEKRRRRDLWFADQAVHAAKDGLRDKYGYFAALKNDGRFRTNPHQRYSGRKHIAGAYTVWFKRGGGFTCWADEYIPNLMCLCGRVKDIHRAIRHYY